MHDFAQSAGIPSPNLQGCHVQQTRGEAKPLQRLLLLLLFGTVLGIFRKGLTYQEPFSHPSSLGNPWKDYLTIKELKQEKWQSEPPHHSRLGGGYKCSEIRYTYETGLCVCVLTCRMWNTWLSTQSDCDEFCMLENKGTYKIFCSRYIFYIALYYKYIK